MPTSITATRYNALQARLATIYGPNNPAGTLIQKRTGYGQPVRSGQVVGDFDTNSTSTSKVTAPQWVNLYVDMIGSRVHQVGASNFTPTNFLPVTATEKVDEAFLTYLETLMTTIETSYGTVAPGVNVLENAVDGTGTSINPTRTTNWNGELFHEFTITFASQPLAAGFFNGGGDIRLDPALTLPASYNTKTFDWYKMLRDIGTIIIDGSTTETTGSLTTIPASGVGYHSLTTTYTVLTSITGVSYADNEFRVRAKVNSTGNIITISVEFRDLDVGDQQLPGTNPGNDGIIVPGPAVDEDIQGTLTNTVQLLRPNSTFSFNNQIYDGVVVPKPTCLNLKALVN